MKKILVEKLISKIKRSVNAHEYLGKTPSLEEKHIANLKMLTDRNVLLQKMKKNAVVAELGVDKGGFSTRILENCSPSKLHLIDFWGSSRYNEDKKKEVYQKFDSQIKSGEVQIDLGLSTDVVSQYEEDYFDWIYIDTDHSYKTTKAELELWSQKVKKDGIMAGHDFTLGNWQGLVRYGVIEAVYEFCVEQNWELIYLTMEPHGYQSFAIRRI